MSAFIYNDLEYTLVPRAAAWDVVVLRGGKTATVGAGLFGGADAETALAGAQKLVRTLAPVGVRLVGPDVAHPLRFGELKIVQPDVTHPNFIYWDKDSTSCPKTV